jgi:hypothetical protein
VHQQKTARSSKLTSTSIGARSLLQNFYSTRFRYEDESERGHNQIQPTHKSLKLLKNKYTTKNIWNSNMKQKEREREKGFIRDRLWHQTRRLALELSQCPLSADTL